MQDNLTKECEALGRLLFAKTAGLIDEAQFEKEASGILRVATPFARKLVGIRKSLRPITDFAKKNPWHAAGAGAGAMILGANMFGGDKYYGYPYPRRLGYGGYYG